MTPASRLRGIPPRPAAVPASVRLQGGTAPFALLDRKLPAAYSEALSGGGPVDRGTHRAFPTPVRAGGMEDTDGSSDAPARRVGSGQKIDDAVGANRCDGVHLAGRYGEGPDRPTGRGGRGCTPSPPVPSRFSGAGKPIGGRSGRSAARCRPGPRRLPGSRTGLWWRRCRNRPRADAHRVPRFTRRAVNRSDGRRGVGPG